MESTQPLDSMLLGLENHLRLDASSGILFYIQIRDQMCDLIRRGVIPRGAQLPSHQELSEHLGVSRVTIGQAVAELKRQGLVTSRRGSGTFVAEQKAIRCVSVIHGFSEYVRAIGRQPGSRILVATVTEPGPRVEELLGTSRVFLLQRVRLIDGIPATVETVRVPYDLCPGIEHLDFEKESLYAVMETRYGLHRVDGTLRIGAGQVADQEAQLLGVQPGESALCVEVLSRIADGRPVEFSENVYRGDKFTLVVEATRGSGLRLRDHAL